MRGAKVPGIGTLGKWRSHQRRRPGKRRGVFGRRVLQLEKKSEFAVPRSTRGYQPVVSGRVSPGPVFRETPFDSWDSASES